MLKMSGFVCKVLLQMFFSGYSFYVLKSVQSLVKWAFVGTFCTKSNTNAFPIFILRFSLVIYLTWCYTMPVNELQITKLF